MPGPARPRGQLSERLRVTVAQALAGPCSVTVGWAALRHSEPGSWQQGSRSRVTVTRRGTVTVTPAVTVSVAGTATVTVTVAAAGATVNVFLTCQ